MSDSQAVLDAIYEESHQRGWDARELIALCIAESQLGIFMQNPGDDAWGSAGPGHQNLIYAPEADEVFAGWSDVRRRTISRNDPRVVRIREKYLTDMPHAIRVAANRYGSFRSGGYGGSQRWTWEAGSEDGVISALCLYNSGYYNPWANPNRANYARGYRESRPYPESRVSEDDVAIADLEARINLLEVEKRAMADELERKQAQIDALVSQRGWLHGDLADALSKEANNIKGSLGALESAIQGLRDNTAPL